MLDRPESALAVRSAPGGVVLVDRSCGQCPGCAAGAPLWCSDPLAEGRDLTPVVAPERVDPIRTALCGAAALLEAPAPSTVLVVDEPRSLLTLLVQALLPGRVVVGQDPRAASVRSALDRLEASGRASVVVASDDVRVGVRAVRRGGHVCVADPGARMPSVTELVQREVTLVGPRDVAGVVRRLGTTGWASALATAA